MKKNVKVFLMGMLVAMLLMSTAFGSAVKESIEVVLNSVNLTVNGKKVDADTILYEGTTYVPLRATAEMLGKDVGWNGATSTASINDKGATKPSVKGYSRTNPAPVGVKQTIKVESILDVYTAEVTLTELIRGSKAWDIIRESNRFNDEPAADEEYILTKIKIKMLSVEGDKKIDTSPVYFDVYSENNVKYDRFMSVAGLNPSISTSLYEGGEHEGYAAYLVKKTDVSPKLVYGQEYDGTGGIWFKLSK